MPLYGLMSCEAYTRMLRMTRYSFAKLLLLFVVAVVVLVAAAALLGVLPATAAVLISLTGTLVATSVAYLAVFRGPEIRLRLAPAQAFENWLTSGYSAGMPSTWNLATNLLALNDGARTGVVTRFGVDTDRVTHLPKPPRAFDVSFSELERKTAPDNRVHGYSFDVPLPLLLPPQGREKVLFRTTLSFTTADPSLLADDLREINGLRVTFRYWAGTEDAPKERREDVELSYDELRKGVRAYWADVQQYHHYVRRLDGQEVGG